MAWPHMRGPPEPAYRRSDPNFRAGGGVERDHVRLGRRLDHARSERTPQPTSRAAARAAEAACVAIANVVSTCIVAAGGTRDRGIDGRRHRGFRGCGAEAPTLAGHRLPVPPAPAAPLCRPRRRFRRYPATSRATRTTRACSATGSGRSRAATFAGGATRRSRRAGCSGSRRTAGSGSRRTARSGTRRTALAGGSAGTPTCLRNPSCRSSPPFHHGADVAARVFCAAGAAARPARAAGRAESRQCHRKPSTESSPPHATRSAHQANREKDVPRSHGRPRSAQRLKDPEAQLGIGRVKRPLGAKPTWLEKFSDAVDTRGRAPAGTGMPVCLVRPSAQCPPGAGFRSNMSA